jgi:hypothetical protein
MAFTFASTLAFGIATTAIVAAQTSSPMRPGRWEVTMQMQMANLPMQLPSTKTTSCITAEQLAKDPSSGLPRGAQNSGEGQCEVADYRFAGSTATWKIVCSSPQAMTADGEMTFMDDAYAGTMKMMTPQGAMSMQLAGKRLGDCTP